MYIKHKGMHIKHHTYLCLVSPVAIKRSRMMSSSVNTSLVRKRSTSIFICPWESRDDTVCGNSNAGSKTITETHFYNIRTYTCTLLHTKPILLGTISSNTQSVGEADSNLCQAKTAALLELRNGTALLVTGHAAQRIHCTHSTQHTDEYIGQHCHIRIRMYKHTTAHYSSHHALTYVRTYMCALLTDQAPTMCTASEFLSDHLTVTNPG